MEWKRSGSAVEPGAEPRKQISKTQSGFLCRTFSIGNFYTMGIAWLIMEKSRPCTNRLRPALLYLWE